MTGAIMRFAAAGILFLTCSGIAVDAHVADRQEPALAAVAGFCRRLLGAVLAGQAVGAVHHIPGPYT